MPHMSPILWTFIMIMSLFMILLMMNMIYFNISLYSPKILKLKKELTLLNWKW
uniref:ATP synthase F0 subunit 8 n=1 Tax=Gibbosaverruca weijiai TaxID=2977348 RepID=UPI0021CCE161|nr:ATP synthase F0 subunit 8 [Gibbosaverruca weijiai]UWM12924.1 ATP synthase F0 subunit 8 [Gibbosaverruca weijiai]